MKWWYSSFVVLVMSLTRNARVVSFHPINPKNPKNPKNSINPILDVVGRRRALPCLRRAVEKGRKWGVDDSHNHVHALDVLRLAFRIMPSSVPRTVMEKVMVCALLHDTIDRKYMLTEAAREQETRDLGRFLRHSLGYSVTEASRLETIMTDMSYHKTVREGRFVVPSSIVDAEEETQTVYHLVRQADLLSSYDIERMLLYKYHRLFPENQHPRIETRMRLVCEDVFQTFATRVQPLASIPGIFPSKAARDLAESLYRESALKMHFLERDGIHLYSPKQFRLYRVLPVVPFPTQK